MPKVFDQIRATTEWREPLPPVEIAMRGVRSIQKRLANPALPADCRTIALRELKRWRLLIMLARGGKSL